MCDSCQVLRINGIVCHETGCPNSYKNKKVECKECGQVFAPEENGQKFCSGHCQAMYYNQDCDCEFCQESEKELEAEND